MNSKKTKTTTLWNMSTPGNQEGVAVEIHVTTTDILRQGGIY